MSYTDTEKAHHIQNYLLHYIVVYATFFPRSVNKTCRKYTQTFLKWWKHYFFLYLKIILTQKCWYHSPKVSSIAVYKDQW